MYVLRTTIMYDMMNSHELFLYHVKTLRCNITHIETIKSMIYNKHNSEYEIRGVSVDPVSARFIVF